MAEKIRFEDMVKKLAKQGEDIVRQLSADKVDLLHMAVGISGEAGELLDAIKKHVVYNKDLDIENVVEELGDLEFYMEGLRARLLITRDLTLEKNIEKLSVRYEGLRYTDQQAQERKDKEQA